MDTLGFLSEAAFQIKTAPYSISKVGHTGAQASQQSRISPQDVIPSPSVLDARLRHFIHTCSLKAICTTFCVPSFNSAIIYLECIRTKKTSECGLYHSELTTQWKCVPQFCSLLCRLWKCVGFLQWSGWGRVTVGWIGLAPQSKKILFKIIVCLMAIILSPPKNHSQHAKQQWSLVSRDTEERMVVTRTAFLKFLVWDPPMYWNPNFGCLWN